MSNVMTVIDLARAEGNESLRLSRDAPDRVQVEAAAPLLFRIRSVVPKTGAWVLRGNVSLPSPVPYAPAQTMQGLRRLQTAPDGDLVFTATGLPPGRHTVRFSADVEGRDEGRATTHRVAGTLVLDVV